MGNACYILDPCPSMNDKVLRICRQLLADTENCRQAKLPDLEKLEQSFRITIKAWSRLQDEFLGYRFDTTEEEINFFKYIKPLFTGRIEFYAMAYKAALFCPEDNKKQLRSFWKEELKKLHTFRKNNEGFVAYYEKGFTSLDQDYFLETKESSAPTPYHLGAELSSSHDYLASAILAHEMYHKYVLDQLEKLRDAG